MLTKRGTEELGAGIYVDVENMQGLAQLVITELVENWPATPPEPSRLFLYVRADQSELWRMWAESCFPSLSIYSKGVQHFSASHSKNSADIAIAVDAIADILLERINFVVVVSDDSDFISLYSKISAEQSRLGFENGKVPFLWVLTDRAGTRSSTIKDYFPNSHIHIVSLSREHAEAPEGVENNILLEPPEVVESESDDLEAIAQAIIKGIPSGKFKSTDCQKIIRRHWRNHKLAKVSEQNFGVEFRKDLWPILEKLGVVEPNPNRQPRRYEMTQKAKNAAK